MVCCGQREGGRKEGGETSVEGTALHHDGKSTLHTVAITTTKEGERGEEKGGVEGW